MCNNRTTSEKVEVEHAQLGNKRAFDSWTLTLIINGNTHCLAITKKEWDALHAAGLPVEG